MRFPKHRANCYIVMRYPSATAVGVFPFLEGAEDFRDACMQEFVDKGFTKDDVSFEVHMSTYYDA